MDPSVQQRETGNSLCFAAAHFYKHDSNHPQQKKNQHISICSESTALMSVRFGGGSIKLPMNWSSVAKCYSEIYATTPPLRSPPLPSQVTALRVKENGWKEGKKKQERKWSTKECDWSDFAAEPTVPEAEEGIFPETERSSNYTKGKKKNHKTKQKTHHKTRDILHEALKKISFPSKQSSLSVFIHRSESCISPTPTQHCRTHSLRQSGRSLHYMDIRRAVLHWASDTGCNRRLEMG